jgi:hypothetical protein
MAAALPGEGENTAPAEGSRSANSLVIPPVLLASPSVTYEVREQAPAAVMLVNSNANVEMAQDHALLSLSGADVLEDSLLAVNAKTKTTIDSADEASWEDLLSDLAAGQ